eukprot:CAMPEP_0194744606 /NCGR_PEP_ID=MMETSP0296-20130528/100961_1 /TAXON_ID=39354 /ORGANISM="Heterosigma akashiwo, Strain CCMP2393" /LENGTH=248 /DNA_ID=CAMNT_0039656765 /DNA_START=151 /DNA_END=897 /DNA_ORIENTATION=+
MWAGGIVEEKLGPGLTAFLGGSILSGGIIFSSLARSLWAFIALYGVCFGLGLALAYPCPLSCGFQWMPRHKGLVSGFIVSGFGGGAFVFNQVATRLANPEDATASEVGADGRLYYGPDVTDRVPAMLRALGGCYFVLVLLGSLVLRDPPRRRGLLRAGAARVSGASGPAEAPGREHLAAGRRHRDRRQVHGHDGLGRQAAQAEAQDEDENVHAGRDGGDECAQDPARVLDQRPAAAHSSGAFAWGAGP